MQIERRKHLVKFKSNIVLAKRKQNETECLYITTITTTTKTTTTTKLRLYAGSKKTIITTTASLSPLILCVLYAGISRLFCDIHGLSL